METRIDPRVVEKAKTDDGVFLGLSERMYPSLWRDIFLLKARYGGNPMEMQNMIEARIRLAQGTMEIPFSEFGNGERLAGLVRSNIRAFFI